MCKWLLRLAVIMFCLMVSMPVFAASRSMIQDGWYKIVPVHAQNKALDAAGAGTNVGTNLQIWESVDVPQQKFYVQHRGNGWYSFKAGHCDLYVDAQWGSPARGENVWLYSWNGTDSQLWGLYAAGDGYYIETKLQSDLVFDCAGGQTHDGNNVQLWTKENVNWHKWKFVPVSLSKTPSNTSEKYAVATSGSNLLLRSGPGTGYGIKARMPNGSTVDVYSINNGWAELNYNGTRGYASAAYLRKLEPEPVTNKFDYPLSNTYVCGNNWGTYYSAKGNKHLGIDIKSNSGDDNVYAPASGQVVQTGWNKDNGNTITIKHNINGQIIYTFYGHLASIGVSRGANVHKGQKIGIVGNTGESSTGKHLHFAITTQTSAGVWGYGSVSGNIGTKNGYRFYNPHYVVQNNRLP